MKGLREVIQRRLMFQTKLSFPTQAGGERGSGLYEDVQYQVRDYKRSSSALLTLGGGIG